MVFQNYLGDGLQRADHSGKLHQNVRTVFSAVYHRADVLQMPGGSCQPVLNIFRVFMVVQVLVAVCMVMVVMLVRMVMRVFMFMKMLLIQFIHACHHLSFLYFTKFRAGS